MRTLRPAFALVLVLGGCAEEAPAVEAPAVPVTGGACRYTDVPGTVEIGSITWGGVGASVSLSFSPTTPGGPLPWGAATHFELPCAQCVPQLGIRRGTSVPVTARALVSGACAPFEIAPWDVSRCDCTAPPLPDRVAWVSLAPVTHTLPLDMGGMPPAVVPPPSAGLAPPSPFVADAAPMALALEGSGWSCSVRFGGAGGRPTSVSVACAGPGEPVEAEGHCGAGGWLATLGAIGAQHQVTFQCGPDFGDR